MPEENLDTGNKRNKSNILTFLLLIVLILAIAFFAYLKSQDMDFRDMDMKSVNLKAFIENKFFPDKQEQKDGQAVELKFDPKENISFGVYKDTIIKCTGSSITGLNKKGDWLWDIKASLSNPLIRVKGNQMLIADLGGKEVYIVEGRNVKWSKRLENAIINADIGENGYVSIVHEEKRCTAAVTVFNPQGMERFTRGIGEKSVLSANVSPSRKQVIINCIDTSGVTADLNLVFVDMNTGEPFAHIPAKNTIFPFVWYLKDDSVIAVSENTILCSNSEHTAKQGTDDKTSEKYIKWKKEYENKRILSAQILLEKYAIAAICDENRSGLFEANKSEIVIFNGKGQENSILTVEGEVRSIKTYEDIIAVNTGREVHFVSSKGNFLGKVSSKIDIAELHFFNKQEVLLVSKGSITVRSIAD